MSESFPFSFPCTKKELDTPCANCGKNYGDHFGLDCPNLKTSFIPLFIKLTKKEREDLLNPDNLPF